jgi:hypothetical protein
MEAWDQFCATARRSQSSIMGVVTALIPSVLKSLGTVFRVWRLHRRQRRTRVKRSNQKENGGEIEAKRSVHALSSPSPNTILIQLVCFHDSEADVKAGGVALLVGTLPPFFDSSAFKRPSRLE